MSIDISANTSLFPEASFVVAAVLASTTILSTWRSGRRAGSWQRAQVWAQVPAAALLYLALFPPTTRLHQSVLRVLVPGVIAQQLDNLPWNQSVVALPDTIVPTQIGRVPDLATVLRKNPAIDSIEIIGAGLPARDQLAAADLRLSFQPAPEHGLVELQAPIKVALGTQWLLQGRAGPDVANVELRDPAGARIDSAVPDGSGNFQLSTLARGVGESIFQLRALSAGQALVDHASMPLIVEAGSGLSMIVRAGAPDPDLKYWRRWAADSGLSVRAAVDVSDGMALRDGDVRLTPEALAKTDLVMVDERAWISLGADEKTALQAAVNDGLGLLLRITGPVDAGVAADWSQWEFFLSADDAAGSVFLDHALALRDRTEFTQAPVAVATREASTLLSADDGTPLASWHQQGRGRVGVWRLLDSYRLQLLGESGRYGRLWAQTLAAVARVQSRSQVFDLPLQNWVDQRSVLCGLGAAAQVQTADGDRVELVVDEHQCAGYWPKAAGWQRVLSAGTERPLYVRAKDDGRELLATRDRNWTRAQVQTSAQVNHHRKSVLASAESDTTHRIALPRWPFFIAWLLLMASIWWRERRISGADSKGKFSTS